MRRYLSEGGGWRSPAASTAIYFLLARGERSHWHRVDAAEVWHWHAGAALELEIAPAAGGASASHSVTISPRANGRKPSCRLTPGRPHKVSATGRWSAVRSRRVLSLRNSNWRRRTGSQAEELFRLTSSAGIGSLYVIVLFAQHFAGPDVHHVSLLAHFAVHRLLRTVFGLKIEALRDLFGDNEALDHGSRVRTAVHERCHLFCTFMRRRKF